MEKGQINLNIKVSELDSAQEIRGFIHMAEKDMCSKDDILNKREFVQDKLDEIDGNIAALQKSINIRKIRERTAAVRNSHTGKSLNTTQDERLMLEEQKQLAKLSEDKDIWSDFLSQIDELLNKYKNFNKTLCFSNIRKLLSQNPDAKIGQIEKEAGVRLGYLSRLEKSDNTAEPSMEFVVTAAKLLNVSIDTLISVNLKELTPTEKYVTKFFDKLELETIKGKLDWNREKAFYLNGIDRQRDEYNKHPLFSLQTFFEESECEYPNEVSRVVFTSNTFGPNTYIKDDCFNLHLKNGTRLYLMDIVKSVYRDGDTSAFAKEAWVYVPEKGSQFLISNREETPIAERFERLFNTVKESMERPHINKDVMLAIDAFMNDDIDDISDDLDELPF